MKQFDVFISERLKLNKDSKIKKYNFKPKPFEITLNARQSFAEIFGCITGNLEIDDFEQTQLYEIAKNYTDEELNIMNDLYLLFDNMNYKVIRSKMLSENEIIIMKKLLMDLDEKDLLTSDLYSLWDALEIEL